MLSQCQRFGVIAGDFKMDSRPLRIEFQSGTAYCKQIDVHGPAQSVRESKELPASLLKPASAQSLNQIRE